MVKRPEVLVGCFVTKNMMNNPRVIEHLNLKEIIKGLKGEAETSDRGDARSYLELPEEVEAYINFKKTYIGYEMETSLYKPGQWEFNAKTLRISNLPQAAIRSLINNTGDITSMIEGNFFSGAVVDSLIYHGLEYKNGVQIRDHREDVDYLDWADKNRLIINLMPNKLYWLN